MKSLRIAALTVLGLTACTEKKAAPPPPPPAPKVETKPAPPPPPAEEPKADKECAAPFDTSGEATELKFGDKAAKLTGTKLTFADKDADGLTFGVLGPINEDSGANIVALRKYLKFFQAEKADAIIVTGDVGEVAPGIERVLAELGQSKLPVYVTIGNLECRADYLKGVEAAQAKFPNIVNLTRVREISYPELTLLSLPGHHDAKYIHCATGCQYLPSTVKEIVKAAKDSKVPVALIAHGPPHGKGNQALDFATENVGDEAITAAINDGNISFGFFSNIKEAGGRATSDAEGTELVKEGAVAKKLFMNPGPADATTGWDMNDATTAMGLAAVFKLNNGEATWKLLRLKQPTAAEKAEAKKLDPPAREAKPE